MSLVEGKFQLKESENFEDFMKALGVSYLVRKLGNKSSPVVTVSKAGEEYTMKQESLVKTTEFKFKMGETFDEMTADGRKVVSTMTETGPNTIMHQMLGTNGGKDSVCIREFLPERMKVVCTVDDILTTRWYDRLNK